MDDIDQLCERLPVLEVCKEAIRQSTAVLTHAFQSGNKLLLCGNGGSAADCEHIAGELVKRFSNPRPLPGELAESLGVDLSQNLHGGLPALSLPSMIVSIPLLPMTTTLSMPLPSKSWLLEKRGTFF